MKTITEPKRLGKRPEMTPETTASPHPVRRLAAGALNLLLPPTCPACQVPVAPGIDTGGGLCADCWSALNFLSRPHCDHCGHPFETAMHETMLCGACVRERPPFQRARAALVYDDASRDLVLGFKRADRTDWAPLFARWLADAGTELLADCDLVVPVALHWSRLLSRRFNQAAELARPLAKRTGVSFAPEVLVRTRRTPVQGHLGFRARERNVRGAFRVPSAQVRKVEGKAVLLVDDVFTTGATARACTRALLAAGARRVDILTLARVVRSSP